MLSTASNVYMQVSKSISSPPPPYLLYSCPHPALPVAFFVCFCAWPRPASPHLVFSRLCSFHHVLGVRPKKTRCSHILLIPIFLFPSPSYPTHRHPLARTVPSRFDFGPPLFLFACLTFPPIARSLVFQFPTPGTLPVTRRSSHTPSLHFSFPASYLISIYVPPCPALPCVGVLASLFPSVLPIAVLVFPPPCRNTLFVLSIHTTQPRQRLFTLSYLSLSALSPPRIAPSSIEGLERVPA